MKKLFYALFLVLVSNVFAQEPQEKHFNGFGGLNNNISSILIKDNQASALLNVVIDDESGVIRKRYGTEDYTATTNPTSWTFQYEANLLPHNEVAASSFTRTTSGTINTEAIVDGKLQIGCASTSNLYYRRNVPTLNNATGWTVEMKAKMVSYTPPPSNAFLEISDGSYLESLYIYDDRVEFAIDNSNYYMDTTDDFHKYRVTGKGTALKVYIDGILRITGSLGSASGDQTVTFGDFTIQGDISLHHWDYVYYSTTGAHVPYHFNDIIYSAHVFDKGSNQYLLMESSQTLYTGDYHSVFYTTDGGGTWTEVISGLNPSFTTSFADYVFGTNILCWGGNGSDSEWYFDGSTLTRNSSAVKGAITASWLGRIWKAGITNSPSDVRWSDLTNGAHSDSGWAATQELEIGTSDPTEITALIPDGNRLLAVKEQSTHAIYNTGGSTFNWATISDKYGCIDKGSVQEFQNGYVWLSKLGFLYFDGNNFTLISEDIEPEVKKMKQFYSYANAKSWKLDKTEDFTTSGYSATNVLITNDKITLEIADWQQTSTTDFNSGTASSVTVSGGKVKLSQDTTTSTVSLNDNIAYRRKVYGYHNLAGMVDGNSSVVGTQILGDASNTYNIAVNLDEAATINKVSIKYKTNAVSSFIDLKLQYKTSGGSWIDITGGDLDNTANIATTDTVTFTPIADVTDVSVAVSTATGLVPLLGIYEIKIYESGYYTVGTFISSLFNSTFTSPVWGDIEIDGDRNEIAFYTRTSTATDGDLDSWRLIDEPGRIESDQEQYIQWKGSFTSSGLYTPVLRKVVINYSNGESTGSYITARQDLGTDIASLGLFNVDMALNAHEIDFFVQTSSWSSSIDTSAWIAVNPGYKPSNSAVRYAWWKSDFATSDAMETPELFSVTFNYYTGETAPKQGASAVYNNRYYYGGNSKKNTYNDTILMWDRFGNWTVYDWHPSVLVVYLDDLYYGDSNANYIYRAEVKNLYSDNGASYLSYWKSKDFFLDSFAKLKEYDKLYLTHDYGSGAFDLRLIQDIDGELLEYSIIKDDEPESKTINITKINFEDGENSYFLSFEFRNKNTNPFKIYNLDLLYRTLSYDERSVP